jgi:hypothetical protein
MAGVVLQQMTEIVVRFNAKAAWGTDPCLAVFMIGKEVHCGIYATRSNVKSDASKTCADELC